MATPHISAEPGDFAPLVLMPGDPRRGRRIAQEFFDDPHLVSEVRSIEGWTGTVDGRPVSVIASGMGQPSLSIYATELFREFGVERIVRVGTTGGLAEGQQLGELVIANAAHTDSAMPGLTLPGVTLSRVPSHRMLEAAVREARDRGLPHRVGPIISSDTFYGSSMEKYRALAAIGTLGVEMEAATLFAIAAAEGKEAAAILTVSDHIFTDEQQSSEDRETGYGAMVRVGLAALFG
ncbi:DeoD-type purine-nucleoside phosphorylase [Humibacter ginsenosidimutans]|uniref:Uridine phosphorylase n=1 Tax=Humibacter ginsenosidimutans TaxID=2599293 RepID=A0A5B8M6E2_9MICO|nr:DeoD-type purine-nucleoside phosphorylase [Humibacter ginsenosidimutans]QDZ15564.1 purine-nucleoside phosphorylase [Humibacter ginsenosidimutans]